MSIDQVRDLIPDIEEIDWNDDGNPSFLFTDGQIQTYLDLNGASVKRAAADAVEVLGTSEVYISKKIKTEDLETDGPAAGNALFNRARQLRQSADREDEKDDMSYFSIVRHRPRPPNYGWRC